MGKTYADVLDVIPETVVLAFDIAGITDPQDARRIANSTEVRKAMESALAAKGKELIAKHYANKEVTQDDALAMLKSAGSKLLDHRKKALKKRLETAYKDSPLGVWIDKNTWVLYVVVPLLIGGAGTYMYVAKTGDTPAKMAASFASKQSFEITKLGKITLGTGKIQLVPSKSVINGTLVGSASFEQVKIKLEVGAGSQHDDDTQTTYFAGVSPKLNMTHLFNREMKLTYGLGFKNLGSQKPDTPWTGTAATKFSYKGGGAATGLDISIGGDLAYDRYGLRTLGVDAGVGYKNKIGGLYPYSIGATAGYDRMFRPDDAILNPKGKPANDFNVMLKFSVGLPSL